MGAWESREGLLGPEVDIGGKREELIERHKDVFRKLESALAVAHIPQPFEFHYPFGDLLEGLSNETTLLFSWDDYAPPIVIGAGEYDDYDDDDDDDDASFEMFTTPERLNLASDRPTFAPLVSMGRFAAMCFHLDVIKFDPRVRDAGLGRLVTNGILKGLTRNANVPQLVNITACHFPIFFTVDSYFGFLRTSYIPRGTRAGLIYPRYFPAETAAQEEANKEARYAYTDLVWVTPLCMALARNEAAVAHYPRQRQLRLERCTRTFNQYLANLRTDGKVKFSSDGVLIVTGALNGILTGRSELCALVAQHCRALGYDEPLDRDAVSVRALVLSAWSFDSVAWDAEEMLCILHFLVDHCRVMYRPILLTDGLVQRLLNQASDGNLSLAGLFASRLDPYHAPHFEPIDKYWMWVPVKKPHSSTYDGKVYLPPPRYETAPLFIETLADERPAKRQRTKLDCLHCAKDHLGVPNHLAFCSPVCAQLYYH